MVRGTVLSICEYEVSWTALVRFSYCGFFGPTGVSTPTTTSIVQRRLSYDLAVCDTPTPLMDIFGETVPKGSKIYAIRAPAPTSSPAILAQDRSVGVVFNWNQTVGFNRAKGGDNARAFVFREGYLGTYGTLEKAYDAATEFLNTSAQHEGPLELLTAAKDPPPTSPPKPSVWTVIWCLLSRLLLRMSITSKFVAASLLTSVFFFGTYRCITHLEQYFGCFRPENAIGPICKNLVSLQLLVQNNMAEFVDAFFTQLKVGFVLLVKHVVDEMFD